MHISSYQPDVSATHTSSKRLMICEIANTPTTPYYKRYCLRTAIVSTHTNARRGPLGSFVSGVTRCTFIIVDRRPRVENIGSTMTVDRIHNLTLTFTTFDCFKRKPFQYKIADQTICLLDWGHTHIVCVISLDISISITDMCVCVYAYT